MEVDPRILQANERTLLAWIRTALAILAFGFLIARLGLWLHAADPTYGNSRWAVWLGSGFIALGIASNVVAAVRFERARRAILQGRPIPSGGSTATALAVGLTVLGGILMAYVVTA